MVFLSFLVLTNMQTVRYHAHYMDTGAEASVGHSLPDRSRPGRALLMLLMSSWRAP